MHFLALGFLLFLVGLFLTPEANAQCGAKRSSCSGCHDHVRAARPQPMAWHEDHAFADLCVACHGGNGDAKEGAVAHQSLVAPLETMQCSFCHGARAPVLMARNQSGRNEERAGTTRTPEGSPLPRLHTHGERGPNVAMAIAGVALATFGVAFVARNERARRGSSASEAP